MIDIKREIRDLERSIQRSTIANTEPLLEEIERLDGLKLVEKKQDELCTKLGLNASKKSRRKKPAHLIKRPISLRISDSDRELVERTNKTVQIALDNLIKLIKNDDQETEDEIYS